jgi:hypothetical protein
VATARRPEALADFEVAGSLLLDVHSDESVATVRREVGPVDLPVNNAGWGVEGPNEDVPLDEVRRAMETDYFGAARMIQAFLPGMRDQGSGVIANVTSIAGAVSPGSCRGHHRADALRPPRTPWKRSRRRSTSNVVTWGSGCRSSSLGEWTQNSGPTWPASADARVPIRRRPVNGTEPWSPCAAIRHHLPQMSWRQPPATRSKPRTRSSTYRSGLTPSSSPRSEPARPTRSSRRRSDRCSSSTGSERDSCWRCPASQVLPPRHHGTRRRPGFGIPHTRGTSDRQGDRAGAPSSGFGARQGRLRSMVHQSQSAVHCRDQVRHGHSRGRFRGSFPGPQRHFPGRPSAHPHRADGHRLDRQWKSPRLA